MDLTAFGKIEVRGPDAEAFLNRMMANRAPRQAGGIVLSHLLNRKGTIEAEVTCSRFAHNSFYLLFAAFHERRVFDRLLQHVHADEAVEIENLSEAYGCLVLSGPAARRVLCQVTEAPLDNAAFPWLKCREIDVAGVRLRALRVSYVGELGWELHVPMADLARVYDALWAAGQAHDIENFGSLTLNALRLEKGFKGASELTNEVTLPEADVMRFVRLDKGDFIGRDATLASRDGEKPWLCAYLAIEAEDADCHGAEAVLLKGRRVGAVSSGGYGPTLRKSLAFAYLEPACAAPGTALEVMILGTPRPATVLSAPAYDPESLRPRMEDAAKDVTPMADTLLDDRRRAQ
ncbi:MAG TPA: aminomethyltransferase family protein, partial [Kiloniellaceae bacterium]|nr:aminomethyltransferase family protein [Kiloniellaceae bacterium]